MVSPIKKIIHRVNEANSATYAAALAYSFLFALLPLMLFLTALLGLLHLPAPKTYLTGPFTVFIAPTLKSLVVSILNEAQRIHSPTLLFLGALGFVWTMAGALHQLGHAFDRAQGRNHPSRKSWQSLPRAGGLGLLLGILLVISLALGTLGQEIVTWFSISLLRHAPNPFLIATIRWILFFALIWVALTLIYHWLPSQKSRFRWISPGAGLVMILWVLISLGFTVYAAHFDQYNKFYGGMGAVILLLLYLYVLSFALLVGGEVNALWFKDE